MAAKKYLSLEEAAEQLSMSTEKLNKLRAAGDLRGFADRGTWKFKADDIEEFGRSLEVSSNPDVPLLDDPDFDLDLSDDFGGATDERPISPADGGSALDDGDSLEIQLPGQRDDDDLRLADEPTIVRGGPGDVSDSDVRLTVDSGVGDLKDAASGPIDLSDSDSDVRLISDESSVLIGGAGGSDSDVRLIADENSAIALADDTDDSDVALVGDSDTTGSGVGRGGSSAIGASVLDDDQPVGGFEDSQLTLGADSGIMLESPLDSGIALEGASGISVRGDDSAAFEDESSGIALVDDGDAADAGSADMIDFADESSAIALDDFAGGEDGSSIILLGDDSGIALAGDSGAELADSSVADSGIALDFLNEDDDGPSKTQSLAAGAGAAAGAAAVAARAGGATEADMAALDDDGYSVADDDEGGADTSVILFEDDDEDDFGEVDAPAGQNTSQFELEEDFDEFESDDVGSGSMVSAEVLAEDSDDDMDVFEASDADFEDDDFESGASRAEFAPGAYGPAPEAEFDGVTVSLLGAGTLLLLFVGVLSFDLIRSMWGLNEPSAVSQTILETIGTSLY